MIDAFVLVQTDVGRAVVAADAISKLDGVASAEAVVGPYDVIVRVSEVDAAAVATVVDAIQRVPSITRTLTCQLVG